MNRVSRVRFSLILTALFACGPGRVAPTPSDLTPAEAREQMQTSLADMNGSFRDLRDGLGGNTAFDLFDMQNGASQARWWLEDLMDALEIALDFDGVETDSRFDFGTRVGIYSWQPSSGTWSKTPATNEITLQFPESQDAAGNNLELSLTDYQETAVTIDGDGVYLPTALTLTLTRGIESVANLCWHVTFDELADFPMPVGANIELFVAPLLFRLEYDRPDTTRFLGTLTVTTGEHAASIAFDVTLEHDDYELFDPEYDLNHVTATLTYDALEMVVDVDAHSLSQIGRPTATEINAFVDADVFWEGKKIAEVVARDPTGQERIPVMVYSDGTEERAQALYQPFLDRLEADFAASLGPDWLP